MRFQKWIGVVLVMTIIVNVMTNPVEAKLVPPEKIKVFRTTTGEVEEVDFKEYVKNVLPNEWYTSWDMDALKAGAMAVKTYGWYWAIYEKYPGENYDVRDDTWDQVYKPGTSNPRTNQAVEETWDWAMLKEGSIFQSQYDSGTAGLINPINSGRMSQWGTQYLAEKGKDWQWILQYYYRTVEFKLLKQTLYDELIELEAVDFYNQNIDEIEIPEIMKSLFGNERLNLYIDNGEEIVGIVLKDAKIIEFKENGIIRPTMRVYIDRETVDKILYEDPYYALEALNDGKIKYEPVGLIQKIKVSVFSVIFKIYSKFLGP